MDTSTFISITGHVPDREENDALRMIDHAAVQTMTDEEVAAAAQTGSQLAFSELANRYWKRLMAYARRLLPNTNEAEDLVQEALMKVYINLRSYDSARRFSPWIYRIAHNVFVDHIKTLHRRPLPFFDPEVLFPHPIAPDRSDTAADTAMIRQQLDRVISKLEPRYREVLTLRYFEDMSYSEIADILHVPVGTVSIRMKRGLAKLQTSIPPDEHA